MFEFMFDLPLIIIGPAIIGTLCLFVLAGLTWVRRRVLPGLRIQPGDSHFTGAIVHSVMIFYGLAAALMAVDVSESHTDVSKIVSSEATAIAALYRDVSSYPEPTRIELQKILKDYVLYVIQEAWPLQRRGKVPGGGVERMNRFQAIMAAFEPVTESQKILHGETLRAYNHMIEARRMRLDAVNTGLPGVMWAMVIIGAFISLTASFFFKVEDARLQKILVMLLAVFIGLVIFMILALDRPFRGDLGLPPEPYQLIYDQLMKGE
jgi:Protein of unknown function (DUF4239)